MPQTIHTTQVVTPFGGGYVPEDHGSEPAVKEPRGRPGAKVAILLTIALFGATTAAAITASNRDCAPVPKLWHQNPPSILMKL
ncbi:MAG: hypothetical protein WCG92_19265, partial [Hyphomicrobiales bacterium]